MGPDVACVQRFQVVSSHTVRRRLALALSLCLASAALALSPAGASPKLAFPDGKWEGTAIFAGTITKSNIWASGGGKVGFGLTIDNGEVSDGTLDLAGHAKSKAFDATATVTAMGSLPLSGTAQVVEVGGSIDIKGSATVQGITVPLDFSTPAVGQFSPSFVTCNKVTGDMATYGRKIQESYGFSSNLKAPFVAARISGSGNADQLVEKYKGLTDSLVAALGDPITPEVVLDFVQQIDTLNAAFAGLGGCDSAPPGFQNGLSDTLLASLFQDLLQKALDDYQSYSAQELIQLLTAGAHVGSVQGSTPFKQMASDLWTEFEASLDKKLDSAITAGDTQTITDIATAASQYGMDTLWSKATAALSGP
jgi:hypothetical protein